MRSILFVCTANICRSPMAEGVFRKLLADAGRASDFEVDSDHEAAGAHLRHLGHRRDPVEQLAQQLDLRLQALERVLLLEYGERFHGKDVPDPYGGEVKDFELALDMIEDGCRGLAKLLARAA